MTQMTHDYRTFLGLDASSAAIDWSRVGCLPTAAEIAIVMQSGCKCGLDPHQLCPVHVCKCKQCQEHGVHHARCAWRLHAATFVSKKMPSLLSDPQEVRKMTYCQVAECHGVVSLPTSARERNMLNLVSRLPKVYPLASTIANIDLSQTIHLTNVKVDGTVPTMATGARVFSLRDAVTLSVPMMGKLMGRDVSRFSELCISEGQYKKMLGMSFHPACAGLILAGFLAAIGEGADSEGQ